MRNGTGADMARFTERQIDDARRTDLVTFLRSRGEKLVRSGPEYRWVYRDGSGEHDSVTVRSGQWFDHKRQIGGDAIGFLQEFDGLSFREAAAVLLGQQYAKPVPSRLTAQGDERERKPFTPPPRAPNMHRLYAYLCKGRHISPKVVTHFVRAGMLYEDAEYHNAVFLAADEKNEPRGGMKKSTLSGSAFKQTMAGSDTRYAFHHKGSSGRVYVFEAAVDLLSFITLYPQDWQNHSYLALDGVSSKPLRHFLDTHSDVQEVCLCLDNDQAGIEATRRITSQLNEWGYDQVSSLLPEYKDWNEMLGAQAELKAIPAQSHDPPELDMTIVMQ